MSSRKRTSFGVSEVEPVSASQCSLCEAEGTTKFHQLHEHYRRNSLQNHRNSLLRKEHDQHIQNLNIPHPFDTPYHHRHHHHHQKWTFINLPAPAGERRESVKREIQYVPVPAQAQPQGQPNYYAPPPQQKGQSQRPQASPPPPHQPPQQQKKERIQRICTTDEFTQPTKQPQQQRSQQPQKRYSQPPPPRGQSQGHPPVPTTAEGTQTSDLRLVSDTVQTSEPRLLGEATSTADPEVHVLHKISTVAGLPHKAPTEKSHQTEYQKSIFSQRPKSVATETQADADPSHQYQKSIFSERPTSEPYTFKSEIHPHPQTTEIGLSPIYQSEYETHVHHHHTLEPDKPEMVSEGTGQSMYLLPVPATRGRRNTLTRAREPTILEEESEIYVEGERSRSMSKGTTLRTESEPEIVETEESELQVEEDEEEEEEELEVSERPVTPQALPIEQIEERPVIQYVEGDTCPFCNKGQFVKKFTWTGILASVLCFPCGLLICFKTRVEICSFCGEKKPEEGKDDKAKEEVKVKDHKPHEEGEEVELGSKAHEEEKDQAHHYHHHHKGHAPVKAGRRSVHEDSVENLHRDLDLDKDHEHHHNEGHKHGSSNNNSVKFGENRKGSSASGGHVKAKGSDWNGKHNGPRTKDSGGSSTGGIHDGSLKNRASLGPGKNKQPGHKKYY